MANISVSSWSTGTQTLVNMEGMAEPTARVLEWLTEVVEANAAPSTASSQALETASILLPSLNEAEQTTNSQASSESECLRSNVVQLGLVNLLSLPFNSTTTVHQVGLINNIDRTMSVRFRDSRGRVQSVSFLDVLGGNKQAKQKVRSWRMMINETLTDRFNRSQKQRSAVKRDAPARAARLHPRKKMKRRPVT